MEPIKLFLKENSMALISLLGLYVMLRFQTINNGDPNLYVSPLIWLAASVICMIPLFLMSKNDSTNLKSKLPLIFNSILLLLGLIFLSDQLHDIIVNHPIDSKQSDVIPSLEVYVQRLLAGEKVYVAIPFDGYEVWPTYFPGMWLPYVIPEVFEFDYRWMAFFSFYLSLAYMIIQIVRSEKNLFRAVLMAIVPVFMLSQLMKYDVSIFAYSTELMPITFYLWLIWGLYKKNPWIIGVFLSLCTLSRYAYTLWMIPFIFIIWNQEGFKYLLKIGLIGVSVLLLLYLVPFFLVDPGILTDGLAYYGKTAEDQWRLQAWQGDGELPYHLANGRSFSIWFYELVNGDHIQKLAVAKKFLNFLSLGFALIICVVFYQVKKKISWNKYLIISLFAYLVIFYAFLYVPFSYLYMLPLFVGLLSWLLYSGKKDQLTIK